jgi:ADP-heptose:LPS heptosyltransferase
MTRVLVVRLDSDGDVLLAGPAIRAVAASSHVTLLCGPRGRQAAGLLPGVDRIVVYRAPWIDPEPPPLHPVAFHALVDDLRAAAFDQAIVLTSFHQSSLPTALLLRLAGVPVVAAVSEDYPGSLLDVRHQVDGHVHEVERGLSLVSTLGYTLPPGDDGGLRVLRGGAAPAGLERPYVVVHPGASVPARAWPAGHHVALVRLLAEHGHRVVVTGAPDERGLTSRVAAGDPRALDLGGQTTLRQLAEVLAGAGAVIVGNTGPAHLAAAVGTPVVSLFAGTVPEARWKPYGVPLELLSVPVPCAGCRAKACPVPGHPCLTEILPADVLASVERLAGARVPLPTTRGAA